MTDNYLKQTYHGHTAGIQAVAFSSDGQTIVSGGSDHTLRLWDRESGQYSKVLEGHGGAVNTVALTRDNRYAVSGSSDKTIKLWDMHAGEIAITLEGHWGDVNTVVITPDEKHILSGSSDCDLRLWDIETGECLRVFDRHPACDYKDGINSLIKSSNWEFAYHDFNTDLAHGRTFNEKDFAFFGHADRVETAAVTRNGKYIISGSADNTLRLWDLHSGKCLWIFGGHNGDYTSVRAAAVSRSGRIAISGGDTIRFWKISNKNLRRHLWSIMGERCLRSFKSCDHGVNAFAVTPGGRGIVVAGSWRNSLRYHRLRNGKILRVLGGHEKSINAVAVSPDGIYAVSASSDKTLKLWALTGG